MRSFPKSDKLEHVCYDIRGPVHKEALRLEEEGNKILKLNIGNPAPFGILKSLIRGSWKRRTASAAAAVAWSAGSGSVRLKQSKCGCRR